MRYIISVYRSSSRDFSDADNAALDVWSFSLPAASWDQHMVELFGDNAPENTLDMDAQGFLNATQNFILKYKDAPNKTSILNWHLETAGHLADMCAAGLEQGCDRIGLAG